MTVRLCDIDGCDRTHWARGWCRLHYKRAWKHGDPHTVLVHYRTGFVRLDVAPLMDALAAAQVPLKRLGPTNRKAVQRARARGWINDHHADEIAVRWLGRSLDELYGPDWDAEAAA